MAGIASVEQIKKSPSHEILKKIGLEINGVGSSVGMADFDKIKWPEKAESTVVIAVSHPQDKPELDWFDAFGSSPGNLALIRINRELSSWVEETLGIKTHKLPYHVEHGGIFLKDAAVLGGLGCIGKNNMLVTPELGPDVRLRAMLLEDELTPTGPIDFDPCKNCEELCRKVCPQNAYEEIVLSSPELEIDGLPGRDGSFSRAKCMIQMANDLVGSGVDLEKMQVAGLDTEESPRADERIKYCRRCELACPVGNNP
jgi:epoxyqueuosine reductase